MKLKYKSILKSITTTAVALPTFTVLATENKYIKKIGPKEDDVNIAIVGFGMEGEILCESCLRIPGVRIKAVCDIWPYRTQLAKGRLKWFGHFINPYEDYREMLAAEGDKFDCVIVATPDWMHAEIACACMEAGKHVYCEKEMSNSLEKAREMVLYQFKTKEGQIKRAFYQVLTTSSKGGFYEQFIGENGAMTLSEITQRGNVVQREYSDDQRNTRQWNMFADQGLINMRGRGNHSTMNAHDVALDINCSRESLISSLPVDLLKPAHMPHLENFFNAVRKGTPLSCPAELAYESAVAVLNTNRAVDKRETIHFKQKDFKV